MTIPARVTGIVYGDAIATHVHVLKFPLLDGFCQELEERGQKPDRIIILLTDQGAIFETSDRSSIDSPYWKDTCTLEPILEHYLRQKFKSAKIEFKTLQPEAENNGLDDWDTTLKLVQNQFVKWNISKGDRVIVSHQAGTPAISSAVQFVSLSSFRGEVSFLLSNERSQEVNLVEYSSYFQSMEIEEAIMLLENHDYAGVSSVLEERLKRLKAHGFYDADKIITLLEVAKLWNLSKFDDEFKNKIESLPVDDLREIAKIRFAEPWAWWIAYEEAYLGIIRRKQGNIVEAFFHGFRAFEGIFAKWSNHEFHSHILPKKDRAYLNTSVLEDSKNYFAKSKFKQDGTPKDSLAKLQVELQKLAKESQSLALDFAVICTLFRAVKPEYESKGLNLVVHTDGISTKRNFIFHQVQGMKESQLMEFWKIDASKEVEQQIQDWENKILRFLNFIADEKDFETWGEASLMAQVHKELVKEIGAIANSQNN